MQAKKRRKNGEAREPTSAKQLCLREVAFGHNSALVCELASTVDHPFFWRGGQAIQIAATLTGVHIGRPFTGNALTTESGVTTLRLDDGRGDLLCRARRAWLAPGPAGEAQAPILSIDQRLVES